MPVELNHTIVSARDRDATARFMTDMLGLPEAGTFGPFRVVQADNGVSLDVMQVDGDFAKQHYAFLISEPEFDEIFGRIKERELDDWADPFQQLPGEINHNDGGRGVYFPDPNGHLLEVITRTYGSGG